MKTNISKVISSPDRPILDAARRGVLRFAVVTLVALAFIIARSSNAWSVSYHGQVVEAETGKPIEGAVVLVEWHKKSRLALGGMSYFHNARETLTDAEGNFSLDSSPGIDWNPLTYILAPYIIVFYPGYRPFTAAHIADLGIKGGLVEISAAFEKGVVLRLRKQTSEKEAKQFTDRTGFGPIWSPYETTPNFYRLINAQRSSVGFKEIIYR